MEENIKIGDRVRPIDGSWTFGVKDGKYTDTWDRDMVKRNWKVICTGLNYLAMEYNGFKEVIFDGKKWINDTIIQAEDNGEILYINSKNIVKIKEKHDDSIFSLTSYLCNPSFNELHKIKETKTGKKKIKVGDKVIPFDGSWSFKIKENKFIHTFGIEINNRIWKVITTDIKIPAFEIGKGLTKVIHRGEEWINNTIIQAEDNGEIVFINSKNLKIVEEPKMKYNIRVYDCDDLISSTVKYLTEYEKNNYKKSNKFGTYTIIEKMKET